MSLWVINCLFTVGYVYYLVLLVMCAISKTFSLVIIHEYEEFGVCKHNNKQIIKHRGVRGVVRCGFGPFLASHFAVRFI